MSKEATVVCFNSRKGGVGKSNLSYTYGVYEALKGNKVLFIDTDYQENSTSNFNNISDEAKRKSSIYRGFLHDAKNPKAPFPKDFHPVNVGKNMDLMASSSHIDSAEKDMKDNNKITFAPYVFLHLFSALHLINNYDLIIIDTHNSMNLATINSIVVSNYVISPIIPNRYGITAISGMIKGLADLKQSLLNPVTQDSMVNCKLLFIGNMVKKTTKIGKEFEDYVANSGKFIASFPNREIFNRATTEYKSIFDLAKNSSKDRKVVDNNIVPELNKLEQATSK